MTKKRRMSKERSGFCLLPRKVKSSRNVGAGCRSLEAVFTARAVADCQNHRSSKPGARKSSHCSDPRRRKACPSLGGLCAAIGSSTLRRLYAGSIARLPSPWQRQRQTVLTSPGSSRGQGGCGVAAGSAYSPSRPRSSSARGCIRILRCLRSRTIFGSKLSRRS